MAGTALTGKAAVDKAAVDVEEARLARGAAAGDGRAFAVLYERYERRAYNLAYRITSSEPDAADATQEAFLRMMRLPKPQDGEPAFGSCLFTATCHACHDLMEKRQPAQPSEAKPDTQQEGVLEANTRLPERQREALALRELEELSHDEIAATMEMPSHSVAELISRARINLSDDLHGTALAAVAAPSPECERALPLIAAREDWQLEAGSGDDAWLDAHLSGCERCRLGVEAMREAGASYRAWAPIAVLPWLLEETMAKAAALAGVDWSEEIAGATAFRADSQSTAGMPPGYPTAPGGEGRSTRWRRATVAAGLATLLLGGALATLLVAGGPSTVPDRPVGETHPTNPSPKRQKESRRAGGTADTATAPQTVTAPSSGSPIDAGRGAPTEPASSPTDHPGASGHQPQQTTAAPNPKPTPSPPSQPASPPASTAEAQPPTLPLTEEPVPELPLKGRGPPVGVPPGRP
jgi:RNA polymerase sigma factor (sigma-70 family)